MREIIYLHGLGSSPNSMKGRHIKAEVERRGCSCLLPDLNLPTFSALSPKLILEHIVELISRHAKPPISLIGSSLGGLLAIKLMQVLPIQHLKRIERLVLLAPALDPWDEHSGLLTRERIQQWKRDGEFPLFHHALGVNIPVHYSFAEELKEFDSYKAMIDTPTLVIHGRSDEVVPYAQSERMMPLLTHGELHLVDDTHQLLNHPDKMVKQIVDFCLEAS